jgi:hypothetical protein
MFGIDPEKIMAGLMKSMGVSPDDFVRFITDIQTELREMRADRLAFKPASIRVVQDMTMRMDRIEALLVNIQHRLPPLEKPYTNGEEHERSSDIGHG